MADEQLTDKIEAWLKGKLPAVEAAAFQAELAADPALAEEVELHRLTLRAMEHLSEQHLQQNVLAWMEGVDMNDVEEEPEKKPALSVLSSSYRNWFWAAAALLLLTGALVVYQMYQQKVLNAQIASLTAQMSTNDSLILANKRMGLNPAMIDSISTENAALQQQLQEAIRNSDKPRVTKPPERIAYYEKPKDLRDTTLLRTKNPSVKQLLKDGIAYFEQSDTNMKQVEAKAREALRREPGDRDARRLLAHALLGQRHFVEAEKEFALMEKDYPETSDEAYEAQWNLLLCYRALSTIDAGQQVLFDDILEKILNERTHPYRAQAMRMKAADGKKK